MATGEAGTSSHTVLENIQLFNAGVDTVIHKKVHDVRGQCKNDATVERQKP